MIDYGMNETRTQPSGRQSADTGFEPSAYRTADLHSTPGLHLTADQIDDLLVDGGSEPAHSGWSHHLASCADCQASWAEAQSPLSSFRSVAVAWSERRSATLPLDDLHRARQRAASGWRQQMSLALALTCALAVAVSVPTLRQQLSHQDQMTSVAQAGSASAQSPATVAGSSAIMGATSVQRASATSIAESPETSLTRSQQVARDNQMLAAIHDELASDDESAAALGLAPTPSSRGAASYSN